MRRRTVVGLVVAAVAVALLWVGVPVAWVVLDEGGTPSDRAARAVPTGVEVQDEETSCGSGGCWRSLALRWPDHSSTELRSRLGLADDDPAQVCRPASLVDRRRACLGVDGVLAQGSAPPGALLVQVWWARPGWR